MGTELNSEAEQVPIDNRLCTVRPNRTVRTQKDRNTRRCLFFVSVYEVENEFYRKLSNFLQKVKCSDLLVMSGGFNAKIGKLNQTQRQLDAYYGVKAQRTDNGDRLL